MDPRDLNFSMRSGFDMVSTGVTDEQMLRLQSVTIAFIEDAMRVAEALARARGSTVTTSPDVLMALKLTSLPTEAGVTYWQRHPDWDERARVHAEAIRDMTSEDDCESGDECEEAEDPDDVESNAEAEAVEGAISDAIAHATYATMDFSDLEERWNAWEPTGMDRVLKNAVESTLSEFLPS